MVKKSRKSASICLKLKMPSCFWIKFQLIFLAQWCIQNFFGQTGAYIEPMKMSPWLDQVAKFSKFSNISKFRSLHSETLFFMNDLYNQIKICMATNLWELRSNLSWKNAASITEGITRSSVYHLCHLMNGSNFVQKSKRKSKYLRDWLHI